MTRITAVSVVAVWLIVAVVMPVDVVTVPAFVPVMYDLRWRRAVGAAAVVKEHRVAGMVVVSAVIVVVVRTAAEHGHNDGSGGGEQTDRTHQDLRVATR